ncbi:MAG: PQQ-binding-like beta-propeller repeat protein [Planctomycetales bacterium]|nr:PQQ-binding-like beta-propeller repeat protein [Planctomycetales bacterium]
MAVELKPLRWWIPALVLPFMALMRFIPGLIEDGPAMIWMTSAFGPFLLGIIILLWWLTLSRARWTERLLGLVGVVAGLVACVALSDPSMIGPPVVVITFPLGIALFAMALIFLHNTLTIRRTVIAVLAAILGFLPSCLFRNYGMWGDFSFDLDWRWNQSSEDEFFASREASPAKNDQRADVAELQTALASPQWPGFRGEWRDSRVESVRIDTDWETHPPKKIWQMEVGPAWSSFAVAEPFLFTQEQRGDSECVVCYDSRNGNQIWVHEIASRFFEALGGLGPRATPTLAEGYVYAQGAEGWLAKLEGATGNEIWKVDVREIADRKPPDWGFSSSPLVLDGKVYVHAGSTTDKSVLAIDSQNGELLWSSPSGLHPYSSLQAIELQGETVLGVLSEKGLRLLSPTDGTTLLQHDWACLNYRALQPQVINGNQLLIPTGAGIGTRLIEVSKSGEQWSEKELWTSRDLKPDFNDFVVHNNHMYGFDNMIFCCVDLSTGKRVWKGGRYGKGQVLLLVDSNALIVQSEQGDIYLLAAEATGLKELAKLPALQGRTWNHPVVVGNRLYARNAGQAICYELALEEGGQ